MPKEYEELEEDEDDEDAEQKKPWYYTKKNWGFWLLIIGFIAFCITWFIIKPLLEKGG